MIECSNENIWYKKRRKRKKHVKRLFVFLIICALSVVGYFYYKNCVCTQIVKICSDYAYNASTKAVNESVISTLTDKISYSDLMEIQKNSNGDIIYMSANTQKINLINKELAKTTQDKLSTLLSSGVDIPSLSFTGVKFLSGYGASVNYKNVYVNGVTCDFNSSFSQAGINQTRHSITIDITCKVFIEFPMNYSEKEYTTSILVSEAILVGKVPDIYLDGKLFA